MTMLCPIRLYCFWPPSHIEASYIETLDSMTCSRGIREKCKYRHWPIRSLEENVCRCADSKEKFGVQSLLERVRMKGGYGCDASIMVHFSRTTIYTKMKVAAAQTCQQRTYPNLGHVLCRHVRAGFLSSADSTRPIEDVNAFNRDSSTSQLLTRWDMVPYTANNIHSITVYCPMAVSC